MARVRKVSKVNKDAWLNTYADMVTLILVFFVLLYSMSTINQEKYRTLVKAFTNDPSTIEQLQDLEKPESLKTQSTGKGEAAVGGGKVQDGKIENLDKLYNYLKDYINKNNLQNSVQIEKGENLVYVRFMSSLFFEADRAVLKPGGVEILDYVGKALGQIEPYIKFIRIDGHTAEAAPSKVDDRELSTDRANEVLTYLEKNYIKDPAKLMAVGYGFYRPIAPNDSEANRAKNRRVEILIAQEDALQDELDKIYNLNNGTKITDNE